MALRNVWGTGGSAYSLTPRPYSNSNAPAWNVPKDQYAPKPIKEPRQASWFERIDLDLTKGVGWAVQQPARIMERPVAALDVATGGAISNTLKNVGDATGTGGIFDTIGDWISAPFKAVSAFVNQDDASKLAALRGKPSDAIVVDPRTGMPEMTGGGLLGFFGIGQHQKTKAEFVEELQKRGFDIDPETGQQIPWGTVEQRAAENPWNFGYARVNDSGMVSTGFSIVADPLNLLFLVPGGAIARVASYGGRAGRAVFEASRIASWARPAIRPAESVIKAARYGNGYMRSMTAAGLRATRIPDAAASAKAIIGGQLQYGSLRGVAQVLDWSGRFAKGTLLPGYKHMPLDEMIARGKIGSQLAVRGGELVQVPTAAGRLAGRATQYGQLARAYGRGALRIQLGSVAAEYATGAVDSWATDTFGEDWIGDGITSTIHSAFQKINNSHPLSDNEAFIIYSAVTMPTVPLLGEYVGYGNRLAHKAVGDNDAVVFAKALFPDVRGKAGIDEMYKTLGDGDVARGQNVFSYMMDWLDQSRAWREMAGINKVVASMDSLAHGGSQLKPLLRAKVERMRAAGKISAKQRLDMFWEWVRKGDLDAPRAFNWNATPDVGLRRFSTLYGFSEKYANQLDQFGNILVKETGIFTQEMADTLADFVRKEADNGYVDRALMSEIFLRYPMLLNDPKTYGDFWPELAVLGEDTLAGRRPGGSAQQRISAERVANELAAIREKLPAQEELFHEAAQAEKLAASTPDLTKSPLRKIHSIKQLTKLRTESGGALRTMRQEEKALVSLRNNEFTRNGLPKYRTIDNFSGHRGTDFERVSPNAFRFYSHGGTPLGQTLRIDPDGLISISRLIPEDSTSEAIVAAVRLGGRTMVTGTDLVETQLLAGHGFVPVASVKGKNQIVWAYVGGDPAQLANKTGYPLPPLYDTIELGYPYGGRAAHVQRNSQYVDVRNLEKFLEVDRRKYPKVRGDFDYLNKMIEDIRQGYVMNYLDPIELSYNPLNGLAQVTDGNHRVAAFIAANPDRTGITLPVRVKIDTELTRAGFLTEGFRNPVRANSVRSPIITAREIVGELSSSFPEYRPTKRVVNDLDTAVSMAQRRAAEAALDVPSVQAIGKSPMNAEGIFHGSRSEFEKFADEFQDPHTLVGPGIYTTDAAGIALGYASKDGTIYRINPDVAKLNFRDLEKPLTEAEQFELTKFLEEHYPETNRYTGRTLADAVTEAYGDAYMRGQDDTITGIDMYNAIFDNWVDQTDFTLDQINIALRAFWEDQGYDGLMHIGGGRTGNDPHTVRVIFDSEKAGIIDKVPAEDVRPQTQARYQAITDRMNAVRKRQQKHQAEIEKIDARAQEIRTFRLDDSLDLETLPPDKQLALRELASQIQEEYPQYRLEAGPSWHFDPADGLMQGLNLERNLARHILYDYGPLSRIASLYHGLFDPISSKAQSRDARTAVFNLALPLGVTTKQMDAIFTDLNQRLREQTVGQMRVPYFRDITSLPASQVNAIARKHIDDSAWIRIESRYGREGFHHLLDEAANEFVRGVENKVNRGQRVGLLSRALREGYRGWTYAPVVGPVSRLVSKQFYHIFRFMLDLRWHVLNLVEADTLSLFRSGITRMSSEPRQVSSSALLAHAGDDIPFLIKRGQLEGGPARATELFDAGLYLHNRNLLPIIERNFDKNRLQSVDTALNELPTNDPVISMLVNRFGMDEGTWAEQLDNMMYSFDQYGVKQTVEQTSAKLADQFGWTREDMQTFAPVLERITELNQRAYNDLIDLYTGNLHRNRVERLLNSYWLYWPISYQIKAAKWLFDWMSNRMGGRQTNLAGAFLVERKLDEFTRQINNDPAFAAEFENQQDMWFIAGMFFPTTPFDIGVSLNKGVRYIGSLIAPDAIPPIVGIDGWEDIPVRMLELGPIYSARLLQAWGNATRRAQEDDKGNFNKLPEFKGQPSTGADAILPYLQ